MTLAMFSLAGIPPFAGFFSKFFIFSSALQSGSVALYVLVLIALINTIVSLYYYLLVVKAMFINPNDQPIAAFKSHVSERIAIFKHALRNALIPIVTLIGLQIGSLLGGAVVIEQIFSLPGLGQMTLTGINNRDYPVVQGCVLFIAFIYVIVNLVVDVLYAYIDPRSSYD